MAKLVQSYKGYKIKETTARDNATYKFWVIKPSWDTVSPVWESDTIEEARQFIDSDKEGK